MRISGESFCWLHHRRKGCAPYTSERNGATERERVLSIERPAVPCIRLWGVGGSN